MLLQQTLDLVNAPTQLLGFLLIANGANGRPG